MCQDLSLDRQSVFTCFIESKPLSHSAVEAPGQQIGAGTLMGPVDAEPGRLLQGFLVYEHLQDSPPVRDPFNMDARGLQDRLEVVQCHQIPK